MSEKHKAVLGAIGMYLDRTLASSDIPDSQPTKVRSPTRTVKAAQISATTRNHGLALFCSISV